jgi:uncharacterized protein with GYD domain
MPHYLVQGSYAPEAWAGLIHTPQDREAVVRSLVEKLGGRLEAWYFAFGADDFVTVAELPDNVAVASIAMALVATGSYRNFRTTPLLTVEDAMVAMGKASQISFQRPGTSYDTSPRQP